MALFRVWACCFVPAQGSMVAVQALGLGCEDLRSYLRLSYLSSGLKAPTEALGLIAPTFGLGFRVQGYIYYSFRAPV